jgi:hypothetical protein
VIWGSGVVKGEEREREIGETEGNLARRRRKQGEWRFCEIILKKIFFIIFDLNESKKMVRNGNRRPLKVLLVPIETDTINSEVFAKLNAIVLQLVCERLRPTAKHT